ncbi:MAG TPA: hypothetical protein VFS77_19640 [Pyrinomonadaceae bacterium]|nr:hypothetical protein [Pyrinomonadaceae bacterium]
MIKICLVLSLLIVVAADVSAQRAQKRVKQPPEVIEAYRVCNEFQRLFAEDLDFGKAFEATFTKDPARRRALAIVESEFGDVDTAQIDDATLIGIYKNQVQVFWLVMLLIDESIPKSELFPPELEDLVDRARPVLKNPDEVRTWAVELNNDVAALRAHFNRITAKYPALGERVSGLKRELAKGPQLPTTHVVKPLTSYSKGHVLDLKEEYYQIDNYSVIRENGEMKIIGIRFFTRLF